MHTIGFTASRRLNAPATSILRYHLTRLPPAERYVTGGADGGDSYIGQFMVWKWPMADHVVIVPADHSQIDPWWEQCSIKIEVIQMSAGTTYKDRNRRIVHESDMLAGFPSYTEDDSRSRRSGSWQTIRLAKDAEMPVVWHTLFPPLSGDGSALEGWRWPA